MEVIGIFAAMSAIFVNGATDAPGNVAGAVSSGSISFRRACIICAVFNLLGMAGSSLLFPNVAKSTASLVPSGNAAVPAALCAVIVFSASAWSFGIPTSESHGLIAALGGAAIYYGGSPGEGFGEIFLKSILSCLCGFAAGLGISAVASQRLGSLSRRSTAFLQGASAGAESLCHGIQDGQKFLSLLWSLGLRSTKATLFCSAVMGLGCLLGGKRISDRLADTVGRGHPGDAVSADIAGVAVTLASSAFGIPVSTTYMKSCAMMGSSLGGGRAPKAENVLSLVFTWALTYPVCMALSYILCHAFVHFIS